MKWLNFWKIWKCLKILRKFSSEWIRVSRPRRSFESLSNTCFLEYCANRCIHVDALRASPVPGKNVIVIMIQSLQIHWIKSVFTLNPKHQSYKVCIFFVFSPILVILLPKRYLIKLIGFLGPIIKWRRFNSVSILITIHALAHLRAAELSI